MLKPENSSLFTVNAVSPASFRWHLFRASTTVDRLERLGFQ
jgi:hypothetical protein